MRTETRAVESGGEGRNDDDAWRSGPREEPPTRRRGGRSQLWTEGMMPCWYGARWRCCWDVQVRSRLATEMKTGDVVESPAWKNPRNPGIVEPRGIGQ